MPEISGLENSLHRITKNINRERNGGHRRGLGNREGPKLMYDILPGRLLRWGDLHELKGAPNGFLSRQG